MSDTLMTGRTIRILNVVDDLTRQCVAMEIDTSIPGLRVGRVLDQAIARFGKPSTIVVDNGPEFRGRDLDLWAYFSGIQLHFIQPGKPVQNAFVESFNGSVRRECLDEHWFTSLKEARRILGDWREHYNPARPHSSLGMVAPSVYAASLSVAPAALRLSSAKGSAPRGLLTRDQLVSPNINDGVQ